jgi:hypothetical protein
MKEAGGPVGYQCPEKSTKKYMEGKIPDLKFITL